MSGVPSISALDYRKNRLLTESVQLVNILLYLCQRLDQGEWQVVVGAQQRVEDAVKEASAGICCIQDRNGRDGDRESCVGVNLPTVSTPQLESRQANTPAP